MANRNKKKEKNNVVLPKAWQSVKHRNETAQARANYDDTWKAIGTILAIIAILFVILGGISMTGALKFVFNWSHTVGETISTWFEGGSIITNEDGVYWDPSGTHGDKIKDENADEVVNPAQEIEKNDNDEDIGSTDKESGDTGENSNNQNSEVQNE